MRVLFLTAHFGFLRNFEFALSELAARGHEVRLCSDRQESMGGREIVERLLAESDSVSVVITPRQKKTSWHAFARGVRLCIDYLRYLEPEFADAPRLRSRAAEQVPRLILRITRWPLLRSRAGVGVLRRLFKGIERVIPVSRGSRQFLRSERPDVVLVTPLLYFGSDQVDYVRAARLQGVPSMLCVGSWDHLTTKGVIHEIPDRVAVWNPMQVSEATKLHGVAADRLVVTGAQTYDDWFDRSSVSNPEEFCTTVGLRPDCPYILYLCSSIFIAPNERVFVERWLERLRTSEHEDLRQVGVLIRPHPQNAGQWQDFDLPRYGNTTIWPLEGANPVGPATRGEYHDSMAHSTAVVGLNTSGMIESGILGKPVYTILSHPFTATQAGTLHFQHLVQVNGGLLHAAPDLDAHMDDLHRALSGGAAGDAAKSSRFVAGFVRPNGIENRSTDYFCDAVAETARLQLVPTATRTWWAPLVVPLLFPFALVAQIAFAMRKGEGAGFRRALVRAVTDTPRMAYKRIRSSLRRGRHRAKKRALGLLQRAQRYLHKFPRRTRHVLHGAGKSIRRMGRKVLRMPRRAFVWSSRWVRKLGRLLGAVAR